MSEPSDEQRMHAAIELSSGRSGEDVEKIARSRTKRAGVVSLIVVIFTGVVGLAIGMLLLSGDRPGRGRPEVAEWSEGLATASSVVGFLAIAVALIWLVVLAVQTGRQPALARRFLAAHPAPVKEPSDA